jgi:hypothetical protein
MNEIILYQTENNQTQVEVQFDGEMVWLNEKQMSHLFEKDVDTVSRHLKNIYAEKELDEKSTSEFFSLVQKEGNLRSPLRLWVSVLSTAIISLVRRLTALPSDAFCDTAFTAFRNSFPALPALPNSTPFSRVR